MEEAEQIDKEEDSAGTLVKLNKELQDQKEMRAKVQEIVKTLKETGKGEGNNARQKSGTKREQENAGRAVWSVKSFVTIKKGTSLFVLKERYLRGKELPLVLRGK